MKNKHAHMVAVTDGGLRLDAFLARAAGCGVRAAKRLAAEGGVLVDGIPRPARHKLTPGSAVTILGEERAPCTVPEIAARSNGYLALIKPAGLHTARIAGKDAPSLEQALAAHPELLAAKTPLPPPPMPERLAPFLGVPAPRTPVTRTEESSSVSRPAETAWPILLSRLDAGTSGLVLTAENTLAAERFRAWEAGGMIRKYYLAVVYGMISFPFVVRNALDTDNRKRVRVLAGDSPDPARHSEVIPIGQADAWPIPHAPHGATLVAVAIRRGARHQIRAHLAHAGHPILGDPLYGQRAESPLLHLHHARLAFSGFDAFCIPAWLLVPQKTNNPCT